MAALSEPSPSSTGKSNCTVDFVENYLETNGFVIFVVNYPENSSRLMLRAALCCVGARSGHNMGILSKVRNIT